MARGDEGGLAPWCSLRAPDRQWSGVFFVWVPNLQELRRLVGRGA